MEKSTVSVAEKTKGSSSPPRPPVSTKAGSSSVRTAAKSSKLSPSTKGKPKGPKIGRPNLFKCSKCGAIGKNIRLRYKTKTVICLVPTCEYLGTFDGSRMAVIKKPEPKRTGKK